MAKRIEIKDDRPRLAASASSGASTTVAHATAPRESGAAVLSHASSPSFFLAVAAVGTSVVAAEGGRDRDQHMSKPQDVDAVIDALRDRGDQISTIAAEILAVLHDAPLTDDQCGAIASRLGVEVAA